MREQQLDRADTHSPTEPCILPGCQTPTGVGAAYKQEISSFPAGLAQIFIKGLTRLLCQLEASRSARFPLPNRRSVKGVSARRHVVDPDLPRRRSRAGYYR